MKPVLLCLHGWGGSSASFTELREALKGSDLTILTPDLPGFRVTPDPVHPFTIDDYADWVEEWLTAELQKISVDAPVPLYLLGHSHGGRIAIKLACRWQGKTSMQPWLLTHLYLCAAAGINHRSFKRSIGWLMAKVGKGIFSLPLLRYVELPARTVLYKILRVHDYERASEVMRATFHLVTNEDLRPLLPSLRVPTDLFWGMRDSMTPISDAYLLERSIAGSHLHTYPHVRHAVHRDKAHEIAEVIRGKIMGK